MRACASPLASSPKLSADAKHAPVRVTGRADRALQACPAFVFAIENTGMLLVG